MQDVATGLRLMRGATAAELTGSAELPPFSELGSELDASPRHNPGSPRCVCFDV